MQEIRANVCPVMGDRRQVPRRNCRTGVLEQMCGDSAASTGVASETATVRVQPGTQSKTTGQACRASF